MSGVGPRRLVAGSMQATPSPPHVRGADRLVHAVELIVFLFLVGPSLVLSLFATRAVDQPFTLVAVASILRDLALVALVLFFLWRNGESVVRIGWTARHLVRDALLGVGLFVPTTLAAAGIDMGLRSLGLSGPGTEPPAPTPAHGPQIALAVVLVVVVAVAEETIFRGYILSRLREWTGSAPLAVVLSAGIFAVGHGYEGSAGVVTVGFLGLVFAVVYLWRGSLVAPMVMHFCQDFVPLVVVPLLAHR